MFVVKGASFTLFCTIILLMQLLYW